MAYGRCGEEWDCRRHVGGRGLDSGYFAPIVSSRNETSQISRHLALIWGFDHGYAMASFLGAEPAVYLHHLCFAVGRVRSIHWVSGMDYRQLQPTTGRVAKKRDRDLTRECQQYPVAVEDKDRQQSHGDAVLP